MPVYDNYCEPCDLLFESVQSFKERPPKCPRCKEDSHRVITSAPSVSLKGAGWAYDGYRETQRGAERECEQAERQREGKSGIVSFPGQKNRGRA